MTVPYRPQVAGQPYGLHVPYNQGYDARSRVNAPKAEGNAPSGYFQTANGLQIDVWLSEVAADFSLSGQTGQSQLLREFFPRSFNDVPLILTGNVASTQEYNRLALFVREHQWRVLNQVAIDRPTTATISFHLYDNTPSAWGSARRNVKGNHRPWAVEGYIKSIAAGAVRHEVAPEFRIEFVVAESTFTGTTGIWQDIAAQVQPLTTFLQMVNIEATRDRAQGTGFLADPVAALQAPSPVAPGKVTVPPDPWSVNAAGSISILTKIGGLL